MAAADEEAAFVWCPHTCGGGRVLRPRVEAARHKVAAVLSPQSQDNDVITTAKCFVEWICLNARDV